MEIKKTIGYKTFSKLKQWKIIANMLFFDALFAVSLFAAAKLFDTIFQYNETQLVGTMWGYVLLFGYFLVIVFAHTFFKYCLFDSFAQIKDEKKNAKTGFSFAWLGKLYVYNALIFALLGFVFGTLYIFLAISLVSVLKQPALIFIVTIFAIGGYLLVQTSHFIFMQNKDISLKEIPKAAWNIWNKTKIARWIGWNILLGVFFCIIYFVLYLVIMKLAQTAATDPSAMTWFYLLNVIIFGLLVAYCYFMIVWNRMYLLLNFQQIEKS